MKIYLLTTLTIFANTCVSSANRRKTEVVVESSCGTPAECFDSLLQETLKTVQESGERDDAEMSKALAFCDDYRTPAQKKIDEIEGVVKTLEARDAEDKALLESNKINPRMYKDIGSTQRRIEELEEMLKPINLAKDMVAKPRWSLVDELTEHEEALRRGISKSSSDSSSLLETQEFEEEVPAEEKASVEEQAPAEGSDNDKIIKVEVEEDEGPSKMDAPMRDLVNLISSVKTELKGTEDQVNTAVESLKRRRVDELNQLRAHLKTLEKRENDMLDNAMHAKSDAEITDQELALLKGNLTEALAQTKQQPDPCALYREEYARRTKHRKVLTDLVNKLIGLGQEAKVDIE